MATVADFFVLFFFYAGLWLSCYLLTKDTVFYSIHVHASYCVLANFTLYFQTRGA